jgi:hypothetical protein
MIPPEIKKQEALRRVKETIIVDDQYEVKEGTIGYLTGTLADFPNATPKIIFTSLCERFVFDVTHVAGHYFSIIL